ncbi:MAG: radical SAM family heme chaperone HemW [Bacteroidales bacterium]
MAGIYIHIPFCKSFCTYCGFYSEISRNFNIDNYITALCQEISSRVVLSSSTCDKSFPIHTIYFGGGTPSVLTPTQLEKILTAVKTSFENYSVKEITIEVNPDDITLDYARSLKILGFNRISMGIQTFNNIHLKWMNRRHTSQQAIDAFHNLRKAGFKNISLDLIFGYLPYSHETIKKDLLTSWKKDLMDSWQNDLQTMTDLHPEHISAYQLSIEKDSALDRTNYQEAPEEFCAKQYNMLLSHLKKNGYFHYEISNFALPNFESKHNSSYWIRTPYFGFGTAAHSYGVKGPEIRSWNVSNIEKYNTFYNSKANSSTFNDEIRGSEKLSNKEIIEEIIMLGLRKIKGLSLSELNNFFENNTKIKDTFINKMNEFINEGMIIKEENIIRIPEKHLFISDYIITELLP